MIKSKTLFNEYMEVGDKIKALMLIVDTPKHEKYTELVELSRRNEEIQQELFGDKL